MPRECSTLYPATERTELQVAAALHNVDAIDRITDKLARQGLCRPRSCLAMDAKWVAARAPRLAEMAARKGQKA